MKNCLAWIHHDGSELYVSNDSPHLGDHLLLRLRVPIDLKIDRVLLRSVLDGEPHIAEARVEHRDGAEAWWAAELLMRNPRQNYRWLLSGEDVPFVWLNAEGLTDREVTDAHDFVVSASSAAPSWSSSAVVYQIFPDRFAPSGRDVNAPAWAQPRPWDARPEGRGPHTGVEFFGGDFWGAADRLDHLVELGANVLYSTPFFPAGSTHRYDASTFDTVDPLLGGDTAFDDLISRAHEKGVKFIGDITLNHCGVNHSWFRSALSGQAPERSFFTFDEQLPHGYESWLGVRSLPKFNFASGELTSRLITASDSVIRSWLRRGMDGWRVDVANMAGRQGALDITHELARKTRTAVEAEGSDRLLIAEHFHDAGPDLDGDGWHGAMNYAAFMKPVWSWLLERPYEGSSMGLPVAVPPYTGGQMVETITEFTSRMPWRSYAASWPLLGSHDTARIRTIAGSADKHHAAAGLLMTLPGTPMIFAGDEIGATGHWGEDSRTTFPWHRPQEWDMATWEHYRQLIQLRRTSHALAHGGLRWVHVSDDAVVYLRESRFERLAVAVARAATNATELPWGRLGADSVSPVIGDQPHVSGEVWTISFPTAGVRVWRLS